MNKFTKQDAEVFMERSNKLKDWYHFEWLPNYGLFRLYIHYDRLWKIIDKLDLRIRTVYKGTGLRI